MSPKKNPLRLNKLQLKTLTLFQELIRSPATSTTQGDGSYFISTIPQPHGNHFHIGEGLVIASDATGLKIQSVWRALHRKGLIVSNYPNGLKLNVAGAEYDTGLRDIIIQRSDH